MLSCLLKSSDKYWLKLMCKPAQRKTSIRSISDDLIRVHVAAAAVDGKANEELLDYLSWLTEVEREEVKLVSGHSSKLKTVTLKSKKDYRSLLECLEKAVE